MNKCPMEVTLELLGDKWRFLIIRELLNGTKRFGELQKSLKTITQKVLSSNLKVMEKGGLINRKVYPVVPPKVEYSLTELGYSIDPILNELLNWGEFYIETVNNIKDT
ncbi:winged helix-turn-helix transcriptional regulator [Tepidibacter mesophilus]|uniref:winged helix-turn-helix transcriptional regulator n=1 Tax=Tepidibacter mesophilus TaxID=655607 RepID=UPI002E8E39B8|nr:helix-turn-helix domain-containing protein [Tepidibacter mesophilus]